MDKRTNTWLSKTSRRSYQQLNKRTHNVCQEEQRPHLNLLFKMTTPNHKNLIWTSCPRWQHQSTKTSSESLVHDDNNQTTTLHRPNIKPEGTTPVKFHLQSPLHLDTSTLQPHFIASRVEATEEERPKANQEQHLFKGREYDTFKTRQVKRRTELVFISNP